MALRLLRTINFICVAIDLAALSAHLLELPNKLAMDGALWLAVQTTLYRAWGPVLGPFEVGAVATTLALAVAVRRRPAVFAWTALAAAAFVAVLAVFFVYVDPGNTAIATWTAATLPPDWQHVRARWEYGHAVRAILAMIGTAALIRAAWIDAA